MQLHNMNKIAGVIVYLLDIREAGVFCDLFKCDGNCQGLSRGEYIHLVSYEKADEAVCAIHQCALLLEGYSGVIHFVETGKGIAGCNWSRISVLVRPKIIKVLRWNVIRMFKADCSLDQAVYSLRRQMLELSGSKVFFW